MVSGHLEMSLGSHVKVPRDAAVVRPSGAPVLLADRLDRLARQQLLKKLSNRTIPYLIADINSNSNSTPFQFHTVPTRWNDCGME